MDGLLFEGPYYKGERVNNENLIFHHLQYMSFFHSIGLMADTFGTYDSAFYMSGSVVMLAAVIPFILLLIKRNESGFGGEKGQEGRQEHPKRLTMNNKVHDGDSSCHDNMAANSSLDGGSNVAQTVVNGVANKFFATSDEEISSKAKILAPCSHIKTAELELEVNVEVSSPVTSDSKNETAKELEYNTRM